MEDAPALASNASVERPEAFHFQTTDRCRAGLGESSSARSVYTLRTCRSPRNPDPELTRSLGFDALPQVAACGMGVVTGALIRSSIPRATAPFVISVFRAQTLTCSCVLRTVDVSSTHLRSCRVSPYPRASSGCQSSSLAGERCKPVLVSVVAFRPSLCR